MNTPGSRAAAEVVHRLRAAGHEAYLVGGCVRDVLLGREPDDWDVATSAPPDSVAALFENAFEAGKAFGVVRVPVQGLTIEVATYRAEGPYTDGRHPDSVRFTDAREDAARRDFTVNALFLDPDRSPAEGGLLDFVGGRDDLEKRLLRAVGDPAARFAEDPLRLLRAVRLACKLDFTIEPATWEAIQRCAASIQRTSAERVQDELMGILLGPRVRRGFELLQTAGLLAVIAPEIATLRGVMQSPKYHPEGDVWEHTLRVLDAMRDPSPTLALGALLHDVGKPATRRIDGDKITFHGHPEVGRDIAAQFLDRLRFPTRTRDIVLFLVENHLKFLNVRQMKRRTLRRFLVQDHFDELLELYRLDRTGSSGDLTLWEFCREELAVLEREAPPRQPLLSGHDLLALGHAPGPNIGRILEALVDVQLEGEVRDREAAFAWLERQHPAPPAAKEGEPQT